MADSKSVTLLTKLCWSRFNIPATISMRCVPYHIRTIITHTIASSTFVSHLALPGQEFCSSVFAAAWAPYTWMMETVIHMKENDQIFCLVYTVSQTHIYRIAGKFGGLVVSLCKCQIKISQYFILAYMYVWWSLTEPPNLNPPIFLQWRFGPHLPAIQYTYTVLYTCMYTHNLVPWPVLVQCEEHPNTSLDDHSMVSSVLDLPRHCSPKIQL